MPKPVKQVPNPWLPYMDGQIWEFTIDEWTEMYPSLSGPMRDQLGDYIGIMYITWARKDRMYIRFYRQEDIAAEHPTDYPEWLAGWTGTQPDKPSKEWYASHFPDKFDVG